MPSSRPTQVRYAKAQHNHNLNLLHTETTSSRFLTLDKAIVGLGYVSLAGYLYTSFRKFSPYELAGITIGAAGVGLGLFDLGGRLGAQETLEKQGQQFVGIPGSLPGSRMPSRQNSLMGSVAGSRRNSTISPFDEDDSWKGPYQHRPYLSLSPAEKKELLDLEEAWINDTLEEKQLLCGQAYIKKEKAYVAYEKHGHYGGQDWKKFVEADRECKDMYKAWKKGEERLMFIEAERMGVREQGA